jgi:hypothetical protein
MVEDMTNNLCWEIVTAIADARGIEPCEIEEQVGDVVSVDALERLARQAGESDSVGLSVSFRIAGCFVTVTDGGRVRASCPGAGKDPQLTRCAN